VEQKARKYPRFAGTSHGSQSPERRSHRRYAIVAELQYRVMQRSRVMEEGSGHTVDISSDGVLFEALVALPPGLAIEVSIIWPAGGTKTKRLELHAQGYTVRAQRNCTAVHLSHYAFRELPISRVSL
jgi:hypothetical protein